MSGLSSGVRALVYRATRWGVCLTASVKQVSGWILSCISSSRPRTASAWLRSTVLFGWETESVRPRDGQLHRRHDDRDRRESADDPGSDQRWFIVKSSDAPAQLPSVVIAVQDV
jgi:hypothetical protein